MQNISKPICLTLAVIFLIFFAFAAMSLAGDFKDKSSPEGFVKVDKMPEMLEQLEPKYPVKARQNGIEGKVMIKTFVNKAGVPTKVELAKSSGHEILDKAALKAAKKAQYKPAVQNNQAVAVWVSYTVSFVLDKKAEEESKKYD